MNGLPAVILIKYTTSGVIGITAPNPSTAHYNFTTVGVANSTSGVDLVKKAPGHASNSLPVTDMRSATYAVVATVITWILFGA